MLKPVQHDAKKMAKHQFIKTESYSSDRVLLEIKTARTGEETPESMVQFLSSLTNFKRRFGMVIRLGIPFSVELAVIKATIHFYISVPSVYQAFVESQLISQYPKAILVKSKDYLPEVLSKTSTLSLGQMKLAQSYVYPIRTFDKFKDVDPMASILGILSKALPEDLVSVQFLLVPVGNSWQRKGEHLANDKRVDSSGAAIPNPYSKDITEKISLNGFKVAIRLAVNSSSWERSYHYMREIANSFASFNNPSGNSLVYKRAVLWQRMRQISVMQKRSRFYMPRKQILNVSEIATLFHFPGDKLKEIHNISWHKTILSHPPDALPVAEGATEEEKADINFIARAEFKNKMTVFGVKSKDRRKHVYVIGKTGTGKSTFIANMAINDMRNKKGFCVIDPHGDLCEVLLDYVPSFRVNDVIYLDPSDQDRSFSMNPLEVSEPHQKELVVSGIVAIFNKLYGHSWGPRLEYILRNCLLSVIDYPNATLMMVTEILTNDRFREKVVSTLKDPVLVSFWRNEFANMHPRLKSEALAPILNKVGQFTSSTVIRNIIKNPKSTIDLQKVMDEGKILLLNLSQGKLGEDNAALMGAMIITKIQLAAMNRVSQKEEERRDFYLYVDEFQNFATTSFVKILSEARK